MTTATEIRVDLRDPGFSYLAEHVVLGWTALPGAFALAAALADAQGRSLHELSIPRLVSIDADTSLPLTTSCDNDRWILHGPDGALARATFGPRPRPVPALDLDGTRRRCAALRSGEEFYAALARLGARLGPAFQGVAEVRMGAGEALGTIVSKAGAPTRPPHPALLDACAQVALAALGLERRALPVSVAQVREYGPVPSPAFSHARVRDAPGEGTSAIVDVRVADGQGRIALELLGVVLSGRRGR